MENVYRVLIADDNLGIHDDFRKILEKQPDLHKTARLESLERDLFEEKRSQVADLLAEISYELAFAEDGEEALNLVMRAEEEGHPFSLVFMDGRLQGRWDGIATIRKMWEENPFIEMVIMTVSVPSATLSAKGVIVTSTDASPAGMVTEAGTETAT